MKKKDINYADDAPLTAAELATARPLREALPELAAWSRRQRAKKGQAHKQAVSLRLSPEVVAFFKARGAGWQTRIDKTLLAIVQAAG
ncbi:MAG: BrnA antitoxin family protein [Holosporales bacterium]|jgi:uncharacterized protein (DUF4415 family)